MVKKAVILAGGMGSRLRTRTKNHPKGFIKIGNISIIEQSILKLIEAGIETIIIGTGYLSDQYDRLSIKYPQIQCVRNNDYKHTSSMFTLYNLKDHVSEDFLLLESDLIYEKKALRILIKHKEPDVILASEFTHSNDEVFIETDENNLLVKMSKNSRNLKDFHSELTGMTKISIETFKVMCDFAESAFPENKQLDYESALVSISSQRNIYVHKLQDFVWCEIDNEDHLLRAEKYIYPMITLKDKNFRFRRPGRNRQEPQSYSRRETKRNRRYH